MRTTRLRQLREELNMTQVEVAPKFNIEQPTLANYESGARKPNVDTLEKMADFYGVSIDYILYRTNDRNGHFTPPDGALSLDDREQNLIAAFRKLTPDDQDIVIGEVKKTLKGYGQAPAVLHSSKPGPVAAESGQEELRQAK